ncbi:MAG: hypothetical protein DMD72_13910 [Gemmatimonadetes bacterium]|nr:MAG: hypothetical protein DMD72_13910 [Gemmatimonadota bacterium]
MERLISGGCSHEKKRPPFWRLSRKKRIANCKLSSKYEPAANCEPTASSEVQAEVRFGKRCRKKQVQIGTRRSFRPLRLSAS